MAPIIHIENVHKHFRSVGVHALQGVNLDIASGEVVVIIGPSGSGKSTLLRCINRLEEYDEGLIVVDGIPLTNAKNINVVRTEVGMVFQQFNLFPHLTARDNVMLGLRKVRRMAHAEARDIADRWLLRVGLGDKLDSLPYELSGGQQQRVGIARAVAMNPKVLLLDEITSALDPELVGEVLNVVRELAAEGMTMILVTHEMSFARDVSARVVFMEAGRVAVQGTPREVFGGQDHERLRSFLARIEMRH